MVSPQNQATRTVQQYRAQLFDKNSTVTITSTSQPDIRKKVHNLLDTAPRFEKRGHSELIYADAHLGGQQPCGVIWEQEVPEEFSVQLVTENRLQLQERAA